MREDVATGSTMRVLAAHWQQRGLGDTLLAVQRSSEGGELRSPLEAAVTWNGGRKPGRN